MTELSHLNKSGEAHMVDVSEKNDTSRVAIAESIVSLSDAVLGKVRENSIEKGDLFAVARVAGIQAAKKCSELIPLCHPLSLSKVTIDIKEYSEDRDQGLRVVATCKINGPTGVEMEALTACSVAALTLYDMCKAIDKGIVIRETRLISKTGGKSGDWIRS